jgi:hypothetical protein
MKRADFQILNRKILPRIIVGIEIGDLVLWDLGRSLAKSTTGTSVDLKTTSVSVTVIEKIVEIQRRTRSADFADDRNHLYALQQR